MNYRQMTMQRARQILLLDPIFLDTETTGLGERAEIVEVCAVDAAGNKLVDTLVRPRSPIPPDAQRVHGIGNAQVATARTWLLVWPEIEDLLRDKYVGIYNVEYDLKLMRQSHRANGLPWKPPAAQFFDIMKMYADYSGYTKWQKLEIAARQCGLAQANAHRAYQDAMLARGVFLHIAGANLGSDI